MKTLVVSYSLSGNNRMLADHLARKLEADRENIIVNREMGMFALALDALFNRKPPVSPITSSPRDYDLVVLVGPIWMGKIASPLRSFIAQYRSALTGVAFISVCGGALGPNDKVSKEVERLLGTSPAAVKQLYINDLLPEDQKNDSKSTSAYNLEESDLETKWKSDIEAFVQQVKGPVA
jgi:flavodoxin